MCTFFYSFCFFALFTIVLKNYQATSDELQLLEDFEQEISKDIVENEGLIYLLGYVAHRFRHTHPDLGDPTRLVQVRNDWLSLISKGGCIYPTNEFIEAGKKNEHCIY